MELTFKLESQEKSYEFDYSVKKILIGRNKTNQISINNGFVSGVHCTINIEEEGDNYTVTIQDQSSNGTWVNDRKIQKGAKLELFDNDTICVVKGNQSCTFKVIKKIKRAAEKINDPLPQKKAKIYDSLDEALVCSICTELIYSPASIIPCLHNFCAGCISQWIIKSSNCPFCNQEGTQIRKNFTLSQLIQAYIDEYPDKQRTEEERRLLDDASLIKGDTYEIKKEKDEINNVLPGLIGALQSEEDQGNFAPDESEEEEEEDEEEGDFASDVSEEPVRQNVFNALPLNNVFYQNQQQYYPVNQNRFNPVFGHQWNNPQRLFNVFNQQPAFQNNCQQCIREVNGFRCQFGQQHTNCSLCYVQFPVRFNADQQCVLCSKYFCNIYLRGTHCRYGLQHLEQQRFEQIPNRMDSLSPQELNLLSAYVEENEIPLQLLYRQFMDRKDDNRNLYFQKYNKMIYLDQDTLTCHPCGKLIWEEMVYEYWILIINELPDHYKNLQLCPYGRQCPNLQDYFHYNHYRHA